MPADAMASSPQPAEMDRTSRGRDGSALPVCCVCCEVTPDRRPSMPQRNERIFYDSAKARRSLLGATHYCLSCPGWSKATSMRVVYSRWDMVPVSQIPGFICSCGCCGSPSQTWEPMDSSVFRTPAATDEHAGTCLDWKVPCGRQVDTFDADIIVDASAHQTLCQICRGEGDIVLYRKAGADLSDSSQTFVMPDVVRPFDVFADLTFELSKINLRDAAASTLGRRMGARVWDFDARSGADGPAKAWRGEREIVHYDSQAAERTCIGYACHADCCLPPVYKVTSERVLFTDWDWWHPCDEPLSLCCLPYYCVRGVARELCCAIGAGANLEVGATTLSPEAARARAEREKARSCLAAALALPVGRTAHYFDIDIVADVRAHQSCSQLLLNEGDLQLCRLQGGDASHTTTGAAVFTVKQVPEVFSLFDQFSYQLSLMDLSHFRQNAMRQDMARPGAAVLTREQDV